MQNLNKFETIRSSTIVVNPLNQDYNLSKGTLLKQIGSGQSLMQRNSATMRQESGSQLLTSMASSKQQLQSFVQMIKQAHEKNRQVSLSNT